MPGDLTCRRQRRGFRIPDSGFPARALRVLCLLAVLLSGASCARREPPALPGRLEGQQLPPGLTAYEERLRDVPERNKILVLNEFAVAAMRAGERELAKRALDESILEINSVFGDTAEARKARMIFFNEEVKLYKGEPYERAMAFFYRGVLYMQDRDWDNARACFRSALFQDQFVEEEQNAADWVILEYLIAVCEVQLGRPFYAEEALGRAQETFTDQRDRVREVLGGLPGNWVGALPPPTPEQNLLVITQSGAAPQKIRLGEYGEALAFQRGNPPGTAPRVETCGLKPVNPMLTDSLFFQATTRGGRYFDRIAGRRAQFKKAGEGVGEAGVWTGAVILANAENEGQAVAGLAVLGAGAVAYGFAALIGAQADIRDWEQLPDLLGILPATACAGAQPITIQYDHGAAASTVAIPPPGEGLAVVLTFPPPQPMLLLPPPPRGFPN